MTQTDTYTEKISLWFDETLNEAEAADLQTHLHQCPACQQTYQAMLRLHTFMRTAASHLAAPTPGFAARFETRLAQQHVQNLRQVWLGVVVLLIGTLFFLIAGGAIATMSLRTSLSMVGVNLLYGWLIELLQSVNTIGVWVNLLGTFMRVSLNTMRQPLFWVCAAAAAGLAGLWVHLLRSVYRRASATVEMLFL